MSIFSPKKKAVAPKAAEEEKKEDDDEETAEEEKETPPEEEKKDAEDKEKKDDDEAADDDEQEEKPVDDEEPEAEDEDDKKAAALLQKYVAIGGAEFASTAITSGWSLAKARAERLKVLEAENTELRADVDNLKATMKQAGVLGEESPVSAGESAAPEKASRNVERLGSNLGAVADKIDAKLKK